MSTTEITTTTTTEPKHSRRKRLTDVGLKSRALLVTMHTHAWTNKRTVREADVIVAEKFEVLRGRTRTHKELIDPKELHGVYRAISKIYDDHIAMTLPWLDGGTRVLSSAGYMKYQAKQRKGQAALDIELEKLTAKWDALVEQAMKDLGQLAVESDFPTATELRERFSIERIVAPISTSTDVRFQVSEDEVQRIAKQIEETQQRAMDGMLDDIASRIRDVTQRVALRMRQYKPAEEGKRAESDFRSSLIDNARDLADLLPALNLADDDRIKEFQFDLLKMTRWDAAELKKDETLRNQTAQQADEIMKKLGDWL